MKSKPQKADKFNKNKICDGCAWTPGCKSDLKYYCYYYDEYFEWEYEKNSKEGIRLKMSSCFSFHAIPSDMNRGAEFARYFQNKRQIEDISTRSWISIIIAIIALLVSIVSCSIDKIKTKFLHSNGGSSASSQCR